MEMIRSGWRRDELAEAGWFTKDEIGEYPPYISVGHEMMKAFKDGTLFD